MGGKPFLQSKTVIVNGLILTAATLTALLNHEIVAQYPRAVAWLTAGIGAVNVVLRLMTTEPIAA